MQWKIIAHVAIWLLVSSSARSEHFQIGDSCHGDVLMSQRASTASDTERPFIVAFGGEVGDQISCIATRDLSERNQTYTTLLQGGPGKRYAVLSVETNDDTDADFIVSVFGQKRLQRRMKRDAASDAAAKETNPLKKAANDLDKIIKQLRQVATSLEAIQQLLHFLANPLEGVNFQFGR